jgi:arylsulfatase A-like enzyme
MKYRRLCVYLACLLLFLILPLYYAYDYFLQLQDLTGVYHPDVLLITVDTFQAGAVGAYGNPDVYTPFSDVLSRKGVIFPRAYAPVPTTGPSHTTILTGQSPLTHRVFRNAMKYDRTHITLAEILRGAGYQTAAFVSGYSLTARTCGLDPGFDVYDDAWSKTHLEQDAADAIASCSAWLNAIDSGPFFVWLHLFDPHAPYQDRQPFVRALRKENAGKHEKVAYAEDTISKYAEHAEKARAAGDFMVLVQNPMTTVTDPETLHKNWTAYLSEVSYADHALLQLQRILQKKDRWDRTLVILTGDHGEGFDHDYFYAHGDRLWESAVHVPWIVRFPLNRVDNRIARAVARHEDIFPTTVSICRIDGPDTPVEGFDLKKTMELNSTGVTVSWITVAPPLPREALSKGLVLAAYNPHFKLVRTVDLNENMLFNITNDPSEEVDVSDQHSQLKAILNRQLDLVLETRDLPRNVDFDPGEIREMEKLRSLGYVQ